MSSAYRSSVQRVRSSRRGGRSPLRWLGAAALIIALLALGAWAVHYWLQRRADPGAASRRKDGHALLLRDDAPSLEAAADAFAAAAAMDGALFQAEADVALARVLELSDLSWEAARLQETFAKGTAELSRLRADRPPGHERREAELAARQKAVAGRYEDVRELGNRREAVAKGSLSSLLRDHPDDLSVLRALALYHALEGKLEPAAQALALADGAKLSDPWLELARASANAAARNDPARRDRGIAGLQELAQSHPDLLRARLLSARALVQAGRRDEALRALTELLRRNPQHEGARALALELSPPAPSPAPRAIASSEPSLATASRNQAGPAR
jgi:tetratricopeptide (TPR) repeat protein